MRVAGLDEYANRHQRKNAFTKRAIDNIERVGDLVDVIDRLCKP
jgi:hypothetical protein